MTMLMKALSSLIIVALFVPAGAAADTSTSPLPTLGKGQQTRSLTVALPPTNEDAHGHSSVEAFTPPPIVVSNESELRSAMARAQAGQSIQIAPGTYTVSRALTTVSAGSSERPITLHAKDPGMVVLKINGVIGFEITQPFWVFENLRIQGVCQDDSQCEHAFHVVGRANGTVIQNNHIEDFNAHIKINGDLTSSSRTWPDSGLIKYNTLTNTRPRNTGNPVTPIDLVGANNWVVSDNVVRNFVKSGGSQISFGIFMKGGGNSGRIERNLVICTDHDTGQPGARVGISFGGGGSFPAGICRDQECVTEHSKGTIANNVVAHCNDVAVYVNRASKILVAHNTLIDTSGIDVRFPAASAIIHGNFMDGRIKSRDDGHVQSEGNAVTSTRAYFANTNKMHLEWTSLPEMVATSKDVREDFCGRARAWRSLPGAFSASGTCSQADRTTLNR